MHKTVAIMQPTYLPWLGYLAMIEKVDLFVFLDNVQFSHRSWQQRNRIKTDKGEMWLTLPVKQKGCFDQKINQVMCIDLVKNSESQLKSFFHYYKKAINYKEFYEEFANCIKIACIDSKGFLSDFNIRIIRFLCDYVGINKEFISTSELAVSGQKDELLANVCEYLGAQTYLSAPGSKVYIESSEAFLKRNIEIIYHEYDHPIYPQLYGEFLPGLCSIDAFFNVEKEKLKSLIMSGCK